MSLRVLLFLIGRFGPLVRNWTMRFEAKHAYFESLCQSMGNFINIPYSLGMRHQQYQCYLNSSQSELEQLCVGPGKLKSYTTCTNNFSTMCITGSVVVPAMLADELDCEVATAVIP